MSKVRKILPVSTADISGLEKWLEEQANSGLIPRLDRQLGNLYDHRRTRHSFPFRTIREMRGFSHRRANISVSQCGLGICLCHWRKLLFPFLHDGSLRR